MKAGLMLPMFGGNPHRVLRFASRAQELGFDGIFAADHLFPPGRPDAPSLEPFALLAAVAQRCPGLAIGTLVARVGLRSAAILAKESASLASMSEGRFLLGLGAGDEGDRHEAEAYGMTALDTAARRSLLAETAGAVAALLDGRAWEGGAAIPAAVGPLLPALDASWRPPVWLGGNAKATALLAGDLADGWNAWGLTPHAFSARASLVRGAAGTRDVEVTWADLTIVGRDADAVAAAVEVRRAAGRPGGWAGTVGDLFERARALADAGASWVIVAPASGPDDDAPALVADALLGVAA